MKFRAISRPLLGAGVLSLLAAGLLFVRGNHTMNASERPGDVAPGPTSRVSTSPRRGTDVAGKSLPVEQSQAFREPLSVQLEKIEAADTLASLEPYLHSTVPEIRAAAVNAMIRIGDSAAVPLLEAAASGLPEKEAAPLLEAARFLELPDASEFFSEKAAVPAPGEAGGRKLSGVGNRKRDATHAAPVKDDQGPLN
jgi:hypothetical protein